MDYVSLGGDTAALPAEISADEADVVNRIIGLINARIRPAVKQDGGDIVFKSFDQGIVYVEMRGNCAGCPYAMVTLKEGVEKVLKAYIPEVKADQKFWNSRSMKHLLNFTFLILCCFLSGAAAAQPQEKYRI